MDKKSDYLQNKKEFIDSINALSDKVDKLQAAVKAVGDKLDQEDVTNLDTDYRQTVNDNL